MKRVKNTAVTPIGGWNEAPADIKAKPAENEHLGDAEGDVGVLVGLIGVDALAVVPVQISSG